MREEPYGQTWRPGRVVRILVVIGLAAGACTSGHRPPPPGQPTVTIVSALPRQGSHRDRTDPVVAAIEAAIAERGGQAGRYRVRYLDSDSGSPEFGDESTGYCSTLGNKFSDDAHVVAVIGPTEPACAFALVPALNQAGLALVAPFVDDPGLTHQVPGKYDQNSCYNCLPNQFYPTGIRNFARVVASEDSEGAAAVDLLVGLGAKRSYILDVGDPFNTAYISNGFAWQAARRGLRIVGRATYDVHEATFAPEARKVIASGADALLLMAPTNNRGAEVLSAVRRAGFVGVIVSSLSIVDQSILTDSSMVEGVYFTSTRLPISALPKAGQAFALSMGAGQYEVDAVYAAEATNLTLDAIANSNGTRAGVREAIFQTSRTGLLGPISIDANGDIEPQRIAIFRAHGGNFIYEETAGLPQTP